MLPFSSECVSLCLRSPRRARRTRACLLARPTDRPTDRQCVVFLLRRQRQRRRRDASPCSHDKHRHAPRRMCIYYTTRRARDRCEFHLYGSRTRDARERLALRQSQFCTVRTVCTLYFIAVWCWSCFLREMRARVIHKGTITTPLSAASMHAHLHKHRHQTKNTTTTTTTTP